MSLVLFSFLVVELAMVRVVLPVTRLSCVHRAFFVFVYVVTLTSFAPTGMTERELTSGNTQPIVVPMMANVFFVNINPNATKEELTAFIHNLHGQLNQAQIELLDWKARHLAFAEKHTGEVAALMTRFKESQAAVEALLATLSTLKSEKGELEAERAKLLEKINLLEGALENANRVIGKLQAEVADLSTKLMSAGDRISKLEQDARNNDIAFSNRQLAIGIERYLLSCCSVSTKSQLIEFAQKISMGKADSKQTLALKGIPLLDEHGAETFGMILRHVKEVATDYAHGSRPAAHELTDRLHDIFKEIDADKDFPDDRKTAIKEFLSKNIKTIQTHCATKP
jgi:hypothetical protein